MSAADTTSNCFDEPYANWYNQSSGTPAWNMEQTPSEVLPTGNLGVRDLEPADHDGDGDVDILVSGYGQNFLLVNTAEGFVREDVGTSDYDTRVASWVDVDQDGDLDIFFGSEHRRAPAQISPEELYLNTGGEFTQAPDSWLGFDHSVRGGAWVDINGDSLPDLVLATGEEEPDVAYANTGAGLLDAPAWTSANVTDSSDIGVHDVDGDGVSDVIIWRDLTRGVSQAHRVNETGLEVEPFMTTSVVYAIHDSHTVSASDQGVTTILVAGYLGTPITLLGVNWSSGDAERVEQWSDWNISGSLRRVSSENTVEWLLAYVDQPERGDRPGGPIVARGSVAEGLAVQWTSLCLAHYHDAVLIEQAGGGTVLIAGAFEEARLDIYHEVQNARSASTDPGQAGNSAVVLLAGIIAALVAVGAVSLTVRMARSRRQNEQQKDPDP